MTPQVFVGTTLGSGIEKIIDKNKEAPKFFELIGIFGNLYSSFRVYFFAYFRFFFKKIFL